MELRLNNKPLDLGQEAIKMELNSNIFSDSFVTPNFSYPFSLPLTANNLLILGLVNNLDVVNVGFEIDAELYENGFLVYEGKLIVLSCSNNYARCTFQVLFASQRSNILKKSLREVCTNYFQVNLPYKVGYWRLDAIFDNVALPGDRCSFKITLRNGSSSLGSYWTYIKYSYKGDEGLVKELARRITNPFHPERVNDSSTFYHRKYNVYVIIDGLGNDLYYEALQDGLIDANADGSPTNLYNPIGNVNDWKTAQIDRTIRKWYKYSTPGAPTHLVALPIGKTSTTPKDGIVLFDTTNGNPYPVNTTLSISANLPGISGTDNARMIYIDSDLEDSVQNQEFEETVRQMVIEQAQRGFYIDYFPNGSEPYISQIPISYFPVLSPNALNFEDSSFTFPEYRNYLNYNATNEVTYKTIAPFVYAVISRIFSNVDITLTLDSIFNYQNTSDQNLHFQRIVFLSNLLFDSLNNTEPPTLQVGFSYEFGNFLNDGTCEEFLNLIRKYFFLSIQLSNDLSSVKIKPIADILLNRVSNFDISSLVLQIDEIKLRAIKGFYAEYKQDADELLNAELAPIFDAGRIKFEVNNLTDLEAISTAKINDVALVLDSNTFYTKKFEPNVLGSWLVLCLNKMPHVTGEGEYKWVADGDYPFVYKGVNELGNEGEVPDVGETLPSVFWKVPYSKLPMSSLSLDSGQISPYRFLFYYGLQEDSKGNYYPFASPGIHNYNEEKVGGFSMFLQGTDSVGSIYGQPVFDLLNNSKYVKMKLKCTIIDVQRLSFDKPVLYKGNYYLINKLSYILPLKELVEIEAFQLQ